MLRITVGVMIRFIIICSIWNKFDLVSRTTGYVCKCFALLLLLIVMSTRKKEVLQH